MRFENFAQTVFSALAYRQGFRLSALPLLRLLP